MTKPGDVLICSSEVLNQLFWECAFVQGLQFVFLAGPFWTVDISESNAVIPIEPTVRLISLTLSLLELGDMRTSEKSRGKARKNMMRAQ